MVKFSANRDEAQDVIEAGRPHGVYETRVKIDSNDGRVIDPGIGFGLFKASSLPDIVGRREVCGSTLQVSDPL